ncbi:MAG: helix-turn-helix transcriptional regulator [Candidatus Cloacimonetes bacterium]|nr:helix-turn-helix transcriptional regulator [Candidatus Cloacimonadota bacterium]
MKTFKQRLVYLRKTKHYSQQYVSDYTKLSQSNYCKYEKGRVEPSLSFIEKIIKLYDVDANWLIKGIGDIPYSEEETNNSNSDQRTLSTRIEKLEKKIEGLIKE